MAAQAAKKPTSRSRRRAKEQPDEALSKSLYPLLVVAALLVASVFSALEMVVNTHRMDHQELIGSAQQNELLAFIVDCF